MPDIPEDKRYNAPAGIKKLDQQPPIPNLPQQFMTTFSQYVVDSVGASWPAASGSFAIDNKLGGAILMYGSSGAPDISPMFFEMTALAAPTDANVTAYIWGREICWMLGVVANTDWLQLFPLQIPSTAVFLGNVSCGQSDLCSSWTWQEQAVYGDAYLEVWVPYTVPEIVRFYINASVVDYGGNTYYDLANTKIGPVDPSVFAPPADLCVPLDAVSTPIVDSMAKRFKKKMSIVH